MILIRMNTLIYIGLLIVEYQITYHVCHQHLVKDKKMFFFCLLNEEQTRIEIVGSNKLSSDVMLDDVLHVPKFHINLIFVS